MRNKVILALGSNEDPEQCIALATLQVEAILPHIRWSRPIYTQPICSPRTNLFLNRVAMAETELSFDELRTACKDIEKRMGRTGDSKVTGVIPIDIDLLAWNGEILKPEDWTLDYIRAGVAALSSID